MQSNIRVISQPEVRKAIGNIGKTTLWRWVRDGLFPQPIRVNGRAIGFRESDILEWLQNAQQK